MTGGSLEMTLEEARERGLIPKPHMCAVVFNGPKGSGKDYICEQLSQRHTDTVHVKFSSVLKSIVSVGLGIDQNKLEAMKDEKAFGPNGDKSYRELQIETWHWLAAQYGDDVLGRFLMDHIESVVSTWTLPGITFFVSDGGRGPEVEYLINQLPKENVVIARIHREGYTFKDDIRSYIDIPGVQTYDFINNGDASFVDEVDKVTGGYLRRRFLTLLGYPKDKIEEIIALHEQRQNVDSRLDVLKGQ